MSSWLLLSTTTGVLLLCPSSEVLMDPLIIGLHALSCAGGHTYNSIRHNRVANTLSDAAKGTIYYGGQEVPYLFGQ